MSRIVSAEELNLIEHAILEHPEGIEIVALERFLSGRLLYFASRTLQYRVKKLRGDRRIIAEGEVIAFSVCDPASDFAVIDLASPPMACNSVPFDFIPSLKKGRLSVNSFDNHCLDENQ